MKKLDIDIKAHDLIPSKDWLYYRIGLKRFFKTDLIKSLEVKEAEYNEIKYGSSVLPSHDGESVVILDNGNTLRCDYQLTLVREFDHNGKLIRELPSEMTMMTIYSIAVDLDGFIWTAEPTVNRLAQFDFNTGEMIYKIGGEFNNNDEFECPEDIISIDKYLYVSDMGKRRIAKLDTVTKKIETYKQFDSPTWEYRIFKESEIVRLENGIYRL